MPRSRIVVNHIEFKTKKDLKTYTAQLLQRHHPKAVFGPEHPDFAFIASLLKRHPGFYAKTGGLLTQVQIQEGLDRCSHMHVRGTRGWNDISWNYAVSGLKASELSDLYKAMRFAIRDYIADWRSAVVPKCQLCDSADGRQEVDHFPKTFHELASSMLALWGEDTPELDDGHQGARFLDHGDPRVGNWIEFHNTNAGYRLLCIPCHRAMTFKK